MYKQYMYNLTKEKVLEQLTRTASGESIWGSRSKKKVDYWRTNEVENLKKIFNPQTFTIE